MKVDLFDFELPPERIATRPITPRDAARLLVVQSAECRVQSSVSSVIPAQAGIYFPETVVMDSRLRGNDGVMDAAVRDLPSFLRPGDVMVFNNTRVIPARLLGRRGEAKVEVTLHKRVQSSEFGVQEQAGECWQAFARPAKKLRHGDTFFIAEGFTATVVGKLESGEVVLQFDCGGAALLEKLHRHGAMPLPPYMRREADAADDERYQTVFAKEAGAVAAPTAGLHFTPELLAAIDARGVKRVEVTLHVGAGTFLPVKADDTQDHRMHSEDITVTAEQAAAINAARAAGGRIVAVGTTAMRVLESVADEQGRVQPFAGDTRIFITPGYRFRAVDVLMTNFHLPRSTLFMLVSAFAGLEEMRHAYRHAIDNGYRFYSYGDACLLYRNDKRG